jgi:hypothetical protein
MWRHDRLGVIYVAPVEFSKVKIRPIPSDGIVFSYNPDKYEDDRTYPLGLYKALIKGNQIISDKLYTPTDSDVRRWLRSRLSCFSKKARESILSRYNGDLWEALKSTQGLNTDDYYWLAREGEQFEDVFPVELERMGKITELQKFRETGCLS